MKLILFSIFLMCACTLYAQVEVVNRPTETIIGTITNAGRFSIGLSYTVENGDTTYMIMYDNAEYEHVTDIQSIMFTEQGGSLEALYQAISSVFSDENIKNGDYKIDLKVGDQLISIHNTRSFGITSAMVFGKTGYFYLTKKQLLKLFGKR